MAQGARLAPGARTQGEQRCRAHKAGGDGAANDHVSKPGGGVVRLALEEVEEQRVRHEETSPRIILCRAGEQTRFVANLQVLELCHSGAPYDDTIDDPEQRSPRHVHGVELRVLVKAELSLAKAAWRCHAEHGCKFEAEPGGPGEPWNRAVVQVLATGAASKSLSMARERGSLRAGIRHSGPSRRAYSVLRVFTTALAMLRHSNRLPNRTWFRLTA
mmetsp:Transcript_19005/g.32234  ORF Transcript_19005/g.32234 Transcript_19005/m.32234 type:complete len:216 (+) Transcript_19005:612-1259(+)